MQYKYPYKILDFIKDSIYSLGIENPIVGVSGQAGAGKSTLVRELKEYLGGAIMSFDYFFKLSSKERKNWIIEGKKISEEEYLRRSNNLEWFDFQRFYNTILRLRDGESVTLENVYDKHSGLLERTVYLEPGLILVDGVFILHSPILDFVIYVHRNYKERKRNIYKRDGHRKSKQDLEQRWRETQGSEIPYIKQFLDRHVDIIIDASRDYKIIRKEEISKEIVNEIITSSIDNGYDDRWEKYIYQSLKEISF